MTGKKRVPGFAPADITDDRSLFYWETRYPDEAWKRIWFEAGYLAVSLFIIPILLVAFFCHGPNAIWKYLDPQTQAVVGRYGLAWLGGMLGGTLFALKWLYHVVAHGLWNIDRRLWRLFAPHISGGLAFAVAALVSSGLMRVFDKSAMSSNSMIVGLSFLVGYFSDNAVAKLTEIANTVFGTLNPKTKGAVEDPQQGSEKEQKHEAPPPGVNQTGGPT